MKNGLVFSDFHLFARRSDKALIEQALHNLTQDTSFIVLNGDIIDFRWSHHPTPEATIAAGITWLKNLSQVHPNCTIYYIMGNHDCTQAWANALDTLKSDKFHWSPTHFIIGDMLFLHGDLPLEGKNPFYRDLPLTHHKLPAKHIMNIVYDAVIALRIHKIIGAFCTPQFCAPKIHKALDTYPNESTKVIKHIYFGHTHHPFNNYIHNGIAYHNTGSAIRYLDMNALKVTALD